MTELYLALCEALKSAPMDVKHIDRWNQNIEFMEQDSPWARPAVFVEFGTVNWEHYGGPVPGETGKGTVILHLVTDWNGSAAEGSRTQDMALDDLRFSEEVEKIVRVLSGRSFRNIRLKVSHPNNNHGDIIETVDEYAVTYERQFGNDE